MTPTTASLLDACITSHPDKVIASEVITMGVSDHSLICVVRKANSFCKVKAHRIINICNCKNFKSIRFLEDLKNQPWELLDHEHCIRVSSEIVPSDKPTFY